MRQTDRQSGAEGLRLGLCGMDRTTGVVAAPVGVPLLVALAAVVLALVVCALAVLPV